MSPAASIKVAKPALLAGYRAYRNELARRRGDAVGALTDLGHVDAVLDEAFGVLARSSTSLVNAVKDLAKAQVSLPVIFNHAVARRWIASEPAQRALRGAVIAIIRNEDDAPFAAEASDHYQLFLDEDDAATAPTATEAYIEALDFILRSLKRGMTAGESVLASKLDRVSGTIDALPGEISEVVSAVLRAQPPATGEFVDSAARTAIDRLRQQRFFRSAAATDQARQLADQLLEGKLRGASPAVRVYALAWCVRILAFVETPLASAWLERAEAIGAENEELRLARAYVAAVAEGWEAAARLLDVPPPPAQATALFQILRQTLGTGPGLERAAAAGLDLGALDGDGRYALITAHLEEREWPKALTAVEALDPADFAATPALLWVAATVLVGSGLPEDLRGAILQDIPSNPAYFPLSDTETALNQRRRARSLIERAAQRCAELDVQPEARAADRYALWLDLRDPDRRDDALVVLRERIDSVDGQLDYLSLALSFGLGVDRDKAEAVVARRLALLPEPSPELITAMLSLVIDHAASGDAAGAADLLLDYRDSLAAYLEPTGFATLQVRIFTDAGRQAEAEAVIAAQDPARVSESSRALLASTVALGNGEPPIEALEAAYRDDEQTTTLIALLRGYERGGVGPRYVFLARKLLAKVPNLDFANEAVVALRRVGLEAEALELLEMLGEGIRQSPTLLGQAAYLYFRRGRLAEAERTLARVEAQRDDPGDRILRYQLLVTNGDWEGVDHFLETQWQRRGDRSPLELIQLANLAAQVKVKPKRVEDFIQAAVATAPDVPDILMGAYTAAASAGIEDVIPNAFEWIARAAELSGEDGPVRRASVKEVLAGQPEWDERVEEASKNLAGGSGPIDLIARMVRRSWLDLHLAPLVTNPGARDPRDRILVAPFSGWRRIDDQETLDARSIALDRTALVTLAFTGLLPDVIAAFDQVFIMHDSLADLFAQRARLTFHQPSQVTFARHLIGLLSKGVVAPFEPTSLPDLGLVTDIGHSRAALLAEAASHDSGQHLVVHPFPISRPGSFLDDPVPLDAYRDHLCSCAAVVDALERDGRLLKAAADSARTYLAAHEQRWPDEPVIAKGATLYVTDLAVSYLRYVGVLDRIADAGVTVIVARSELDQAQALLDIDARSAEVDRVIDQVRASVAKGAADGRIIFDAAPCAEDEEDAFSAAWGSLVARSSFLACDDRFLNRYANFDHATGRTRILSSLDLLALLARSERLDPAKVVDARTRLRQAGAVFVPLDVHELGGLIAATEVATDRDEGEDEGRRPLIRESAELLALRENIRLAQARGWFDPQFDSAWLLNFDKCLAEVLIAQWQPGIPDELARARSNWLFELLDTRQWADNLGGQNREDLAEGGIVIDLVKLSTAIDDIPDSERPRYEVWLEEEVFEPLWSRQPQLRALFLNHVRALITAVARDLGAQHDEVPKFAFARVSFDRVPDFLQLGLLEDESFAGLVEYRLSPALIVGQASFPRAKILQAVAALYAAPDQSREIRDLDDQLWTLSTDPQDPVWPLRFACDGTGWQTRGIIGLHPTAEARLAMAHGVLDAYGLAHAVLDPWRATLDERSLIAAEIDAIDGLLRDMPPVVETVIRDSLGANSVSPSDLVPRERAYYEQLVGKNEAETLRDYLALSERLNHLTWVPGNDLGRQRACWALLLASQSRVLGGQLDDLPNLDWCGLGAWARDDGDLLAKVGFIELALPRAYDDPELEAIVIELSRQIEALDPADKAGPLHLLSCLAIFIDGDLSARRVLPDWPPYRRRLAAFAQASMIARIVQHEIDTGRFADFCAQQRGWRFAVQNMVDLRREPRWRPDYISPDQLRHDFIGRIVNVANGLPKEQLTKALRARFTAKRGSLRTKLAYPMAFWPGPIEGGFNADLPVAADVLCASIEEALAEDPPGVDALNRLIVVGAMLRLPEDLAERAIERVRTTGPKVLAPLPPERVGAYLLGLAHVAAAGRLLALAETVRVFARFHRVNAGITAQEDMQLGLYLAAATPDKTEWRRYVGHWTLELARQVKDLREAELLLGWIEALSDVDPALRAWSGRARATLNLYLRR